MIIEIPQSLKNLISAAGSPVFIVGGYVRNKLANLGETDMDLGGSVIPSALGLPPNYKVVTVNYRLGTAKIRSGRDEYEYTPFRQETYAAGGGHTPTEVFFTQDLKKDALRRDFTCNAIYYNPVTDEIIDPLNGRSDIERKIIRAYNPTRVFSSDGLRLLRLVRIAVETGFKIDAETAIAAKANAELLRDISPERIRDELMKILVADTKYSVVGAQYRGVKLMQQLGLWKYVIREVELCQGVKQNPDFHKFDVMEHTFLTVRYANPETRLAALLHDIGKPYCKNVFGNMHGHEKSSEIMTRQIMGQDGLRFSNEEIDKTARLTRFHMYDMDGKTRESKMRLFIAENFDIIDQLSDLICSDRAATGFLTAKPASTRLSLLKQKMVEENTPLSVADIKIDGYGLMSLGIQGNLIGSVMDALLRECILNPELNEPKKLAAMAEKFAANIMKASQV